MLESSPIFRGAQSAVRRGRVQAGGGIVYEAGTADNEVFTRAKERSNRFLRDRRETPAAVKYTSLAAAFVCRSSPIQVGRNVTRHHDLHLISIAVQARSIASVGPCSSTAPHSASAY